MAIQSGGVLKSVTLTTFTPASWNGWPQDGITQAFRWGSYSAIYQRQLWVATLVDKIANATARLPLKVYERAERGRPEARDTPYAELLRQPNSELDPYLFWLWVTSTLNIYGEAFLLKRRDAGGRPVELFPWHPTSMRDDVRAGRVVWSLQRQDGPVGIARRDFVHLRFYNPDSLRRGLSPLEALRSTLENEDRARAANSALWRNGGRPSVALKHPKTLSDGAQQRLRAQWEQIHGGVDNWAKAAILEEGMEAQILPLNAEELQYIEGRRLNREESCARYDVPPPVVHILDRATFSNITEQMRSMYRDTMAPKLKLIESTLEMELRDGRFGDERREPDFGANVYGEFLLDEVLRGDFEARSGAYQTAINSGWMSPSEIRELENLPYIEGSDRLLLNSTLVPVAADDDEQFDKSDLDRINALGQLIRAGFDPEASTAALGLPSIPHLGLLPVTVQSPEDNAAPVLSQDEMRSVMGRLSRAKVLSEVDPEQLIRGVAASVVLMAAFNAAKAVGEPVALFRERLKALGGAQQ